MSEEIIIRPTSDIDITKVEPFGEGESIFGRINEVVPDDSQGFKPFTEVYGGYTSSEYGVDITPSFGFVHGIKVHIRAASVGSRPYTLLKVSLSCGSFTWDSPAKAVPSGGDFSDVVFEVPQDDIIAADLRLQQLTPCALTIHTYYVTWVGIGGSGMKSITAVSNAFIAIEHGPHELVPPEEPEEPELPEEGEEGIVCACEVTAPQRIREIYSGRNVMMAFTEKQPYESYWISCNFKRVIRGSDEIESAEVKAYVDGKTYEELIEDVQIDGKRVLIKVEGGVPQTYKITCRVITKTNERYEMDAALPVVEK